MRPGARREQARDLSGALGTELLLQHAADEALDLDDRLARHVGQDQRFVVAVAGRFQRGQHRRGRVLAQLRVDGAEDGVRVEHDPRPPRARSASRRSSRSGARRPSPAPGGRRVRKRSASRPGRGRRACGARFRSAGRAAFPGSHAGCSARRRCRCSARAGIPSSETVSCRWISVITVAFRLRERTARLCRRRAASTWRCTAGCSEARMKKSQRRLSGSIGPPTRTRGACTPPRARPLATRARAPSPPATSRTRP